MTAAGGATGPIGPLASTGFWLHRAALAYLRELDARLREVNLTHTQFQVLAAVSWLGREAPPTQQEVATFAGADRMLTSKVLAGLEARDLVVRRSDPADARTKRVTATGAGRALVTAAARIARAVDAEVLGPDQGLRDALALVARRDS